MSYVRGNAHVTRLREHNLELLTREGTLKTLVIHRTIQDAMTVVQRIGERYLWVNSLCLMQDSPSDQKMLAETDAIYSHAVLTTVAADGVDADASIPGVQPNSRHLDQVITEIKGRVSIYPSPHARLRVISNFPHGIPEAGLTKEY